MSTAFISLRCFLYDTDFTNLRSSVTALEAQVTLSFPLIIDTERFALTIHQLQDNRHPVLTFSYRRLFPTNCTYENRHNLVNSCGPRHTAFSIKSRILRPDNASLPCSLSHTHTLSLSLSLRFSDSACTSLDFTSSKTRSLFLSHKQPYSRVSYYCLLCYAVYFGIS